MNQYMMIRRLRGPAFLLLVGVLALLNQADILSWGKSWPLYLILAGVLALAERAALAAGGGYPQAPYQGPYQGQPYGGPSAGSGPGSNPGSNLVPALGSQLENAPQATGQESWKEPEGGQS
jgi:hypothetical protein